MVRPAQWGFAVAIAIALLAVTVSHLRNPVGSSPGRKTVRISPVKKPYGSIPVDSVPHRALGISCTLVKQGGSLKAEELKHHQSPCAALTCAAFFVRSCDPSPTPSPMR